MSGRVLGLITARAGSKGVPEKNVRPVGGVPLIAWSVRAARGAERLDRVVVSTDGAAIAEAAREWGAEVPFLRPSELAQDVSSHIDCVLHALDWLEENEGYRPDAICLLQPTSPFRTATDIDAAIELSSETDADAVVSVHATHEHPVFLQSLDADGRLVPYVKCDVDYPRRQDLPEAYFVNGAIYVNSVESLRRDRTFYPADTRAYVMPVERSMQIDTPWDLFLADLVATHAGEFPDSDS